MVALVGLESRYTFDVIDILERRGVAITGFVRSAFDREVGDREIGDREIGDSATVIKKKAALRRQAVSKLKSGHRERNRRER